MKIECPCCGDCFTPNEDHLRWPSSEDINLNDSNKIVWERIPLLRSVVYCSTDNNNDQSLREAVKKSTGEEQ